MEQLQISKAAFLPDFLAHSAFLLSLPLSSVRAVPPIPQVPLSQASHSLWLLGMPWGCSFAPMNSWCHPFCVPATSPAGVDGFLSVPEPSVLCLDQEQRCGSFGCRALQKPRYKPCYDTDPKPPCIFWCSLHPLDEPATGRDHLPSSAHLQHRLWILSRSDQLLFGHHLKTGEAERCG